MAWECALENSIANALGPPVVAFLATDCFGYEFGSDTASEGMDIDSARALGKAMAAVIVGPSLVCLTAYSFLHITYPRDVQKLKAKEAIQADEADAPKKEASSL